MSAPTKSIIEDLLETPFSTRSFAEKRFIVENGRPCPKLSNLKSVHKDSKKEYTRHFKESQYYLYPWLAGCEKKVKLYCWPCLLFSHEDSVWSSTGVENLNTLQILQKKHKQNITHLHCVLKLATFGENRDALTQIRTLNSQHNLQVKKNRNVLKRLIDVTCFLSKQELPFREHDESLSSMKRGNYVELLNLLRQYDPTLAEHFQTANVFKGTSMTIQNDIIRAVGELLNSHICKQLELSEFVAIMLDGSDIHLKSQLSVVFRYYLKGKIHEAFVGFIDVSSGRSADDLFTLVKTLLEKYSVVQKLVAQTYDGTAGLIAQENCLQAKVKDLCPNALFVYCYAHELNFVLSQGLDNIKECKMFFSTLNGIETFASLSCKGTYGMKEFLERKIPSLAKTKWYYSSRLVNIIHTYREAIVEYFDSIQRDDDKIWDSKEQMAASGYSKYLKSFETVFLLNVFSEVFAHTDVLSDTLQDENVDIVFCVKQINKFYSFLKAQRENGFTEVWHYTLQSHTMSPHVQECSQNDQIDWNDETKYEKIFYEAMDTLLMQVSERFSSFEKLKYFNLLNGKNFNEYIKENKFPENILKHLTESYRDTFDSNQLKSELAVFYASSEEIPRHISAKSMGSEATAIINQKNITPYDVLLYIENKSLATSFEQVYKLSTLICTIPATTSVEPSISAAKRIKSYLSNTQGQERPNYVALLSIEKAALLELQNSDDFYDRVIENFLSVNERIEFMYK